MVTVTKAMAEKAMQNGIKPSTLRGRIEDGWSLEEATTKPAKKYRRASEDNDYRLARIRATKNGVKYSTFKSRIRSGWTLNQASIPTLEPGEKREIGWINVARDNGISHNTYYSRIHRYGWSHERAATTPPGKQSGKYKGC